MKLLVAVGIAGATVLGAVCAHAYPTDWRKLDETEDSTSAVYVMPQVWHVHGYNARHLWERVEAQDQFYIGFAEVNCDSRNVRFLQGDLYDENGSLISSASTPTRWEFFSPGTLQDEVVDYACAR